MKLEFHDQRENCRAVYTIDGRTSVADFLDFFLIEPAMNKMGTLFDFRDFYREVELRDILSENKDLQMNLYDRIKELGEKPLSLTTTRGHSGEIFVDMFLKMENFARSMRIEVDGTVGKGFNAVKFVQDLNNNGSHAYRLTANGKNFVMEDLIYEMQPVEDFFKSDRAVLSLAKERKRISLLGCDAFLTRTADFLAGEAYQLCKDRYKRFTEIRRL